MSVGLSPQLLPDRLELAESSLVELKLAAGRVRDESDVVELIRANPAEVPALRRHLAQIHPDYAAAFDALVGRADEQEDR